MTTYELLMFFVGFAAGTLISYFIYYTPVKRLKEQVWKLKNQVYYWSRQMPVERKKIKSV